MNLSFPLRFKLISAVLVPLTAVAGFLTIEVNQSLDQRAAAERQLAEIERFDAIVAYGAALNGEAQVLMSPGATVDRLTEARAEVDAAFDEIIDPELEFSDARLERLRSIEAEVAAVRTVVGDDPGPFREVWAEQVLDSMSTDAVTTLNLLRSEALVTFDFDRSVIIDPEAGRALDDFQLFERLETTLVRQEVAVIAAGLRTGVSNSVETSAVLSSVIADAEATTELLREIGSDDAVDAYERLVSTDSFARFLNARDAVRNDVQVRGIARPETVAALDAVDSNASSQVARATSGGAERLRDVAEANLAAAEYALARAAVIGGGMLIVVALVVVLLYRAIRRPLVRLTEQSRQVAEIELPEVVRSIRSGELESAPEISEMPVRSRDEIGELVTAFNGMHRTAIELASEQAAARRVVADMFVNLGRRNQKLLNRMLNGLTQLERDERDPDALAALYKVDHLATRMRRNAESLLVLAGASHARAWSHPVQVYEVIQSSLAEVENFERVDVNATDDMILGNHVADLAHMIAELTENALAFSSPTSRVQIDALRTRRGYAIVVEDSGIGMAPEALAAANERIRLAAEQGETPSDLLGHYVVGRLAARNGFDVQLAESLDGLSARIIVPDSMIVEPEPAAATPAPEPLTAPPAPPVPAAPVEIVEPVEPEPVEPEPVVVVADVDPTEPGAPTDASTPLVEPSLPVNLPRRTPGSSDLVAEAAPVVEPAPVVESAPGALTEPPSGEPAPAFGVRRRRPGAHLPDTSLGARSTDAAVTTAESAPADGHDDPDMVRSSLSGFQSGTARADHQSDNDQPGGHHG